MKRILKTVVFMFVMTFLLTGKAYAKEKCEAVTVYGKVPAIEITAVNGASEYRIYKKVGDNPYSLIYVGEDLTFTDEAVADGLIYRYKVRAKVNGNYTSYSKVMTFINPKEDLDGLYQGKVFCGKVVPTGNKLKTTLWWNSDADFVFVYKKEYKSGGYEKAKLVAITDKDTISFTNANKDSKKDKYLICECRSKDGEYYVSGFSLGLTPSKLFNKTYENMSTDDKFTVLRAIFKSGTYWNYKGLDSSLVTSFTNNERLVFTTTKASKSAKGNADCVIKYKTDLAKQNGWGEYGIQCFGFACMLQDFIYGKDTKVDKLTNLSYKDIKAGDHLRLTGKIHSQYVLKTTDKGIYVAECNADYHTNLIMWDKFYSWDTVKSNCSVGFFIYRRTGTVTDSHVKAANVRISKDGYVLDQRKDAPNGCEMYALTTALHYEGIDVNPVKVCKAIPTENTPYTNKKGQYVGGNPQRGYLGNPLTTAGWGVWDKPIAKLAKAYVDDTKKVVNATGTPLDGVLVNAVAEGHAAIVWTNLDNDGFGKVHTYKDEVSGDTLTWIGNSHTLAIIGYTDTKVICMDSMKGKVVKYDRAKFEKNYTDRGMRCVYIR